MKQFTEMALSTADKKSRWQKVYFLKWLAFATPNTFEQVTQSIGQLLDDTQLQRCADWGYVKIELWQHNDRMISARIKCADHG
jgi:hypothetical protein